MKHSKRAENFKKKFKHSSKKAIITYLVLRTLVILCLVLQILRGDLNNAFICLLTLLLFTLPTIITNSLKIKLPSALEIIIYIFIFAAEILGEINNFYMVIPHWDTILHTLNGFLVAGVGFSLVDLLNENSTKSFKLSPIFVAIVAFCFSMTIGILWEFFEYSADIYLKTDMQKDMLISTISSVDLNDEKKNKAVIIKDIKSTQLILEDKTIVIYDGYLDIGLHDTMEDLIVNFIGATAFSFIGYLYILNRDKYKFASNFIPTKYYDNEIKKEENC